MAIQVWGTDVDPYTNDSDKYIVVLGVQGVAYTNPSAPEATSANSGIVVDPTGVTVGYFNIAISQDYEVTGSLSDTGYSHSWSFSTRVLLSPGYRLTTFIAAYGVICDTLEEASLFLR